MNYYAEFGTDKFIRENYFPDINYKGIMVEVGSGPPTFLSMSKHFRENGWRCICIDPNPKFVKQHELEGNEIYQYACSYENKENVDFEVVDHHGWAPENENISLSALKVKQSYKDLYPNYSTFKIDTIKINSIRLDDLLKNLKIDKIDFLSVDTEGWEIEVMKGFDVHKYQPKIILLENLIYDDNYIKYMEDCGYYLDNKIEYNYIFKRKIYIENLTINKHYGCNPYGIKINFTWMGDSENVIINILDGYSKLIFFESAMYLSKFYNYFIDVPNPAKHKILIIYDKNKNKKLFEYYNYDSIISISDKDPDKYFENIGTHLKSNALATPLYEIYLYNVYKNEKVKVEKGDVVFDIGANIGLFSYYSLYQGAKICYSFEPNYDLFKIFYNKKINNLIGENVAVSNFDGESDFYISDGGISSCLEINNNQIKEIGDKYQRDQDFFIKTKVKTINFMNYLNSKNINKIDLLKLDCEGAEYEIIDCLDNNYLKNNISKMIIEYHYLHNTDFKLKYYKMIIKLLNCGFKYENNSNDEVVNDGILFLWKEK